MASRPTVVLAHYDAEVLSRYRDELEGAGFRVQATGSGPDVLKRVEKEPPDVVVLDPLLPRLNGLSVLKTMKADPALRGIRVLVIIDGGDTYTENRALICGADGILKRSDDGVLALGTLAKRVGAMTGEQALSDAGGSSVDGDLERLIDSAARSLREENPILAHITDALTGLFNGPYLEIKLTEEFKRARRFGHALTLVEVQLERGDEVSDVDSDWRRILNEVAGILLCESRDIDILGRQDAKTFVLLLPHTDAKGATAMVERILGNIAERPQAAESASALRAAAGLAEFKGEGCESTDELKRRAEEALARAWRGGGGIAQLWG